MRAALLKYWDRIRSSFWFLPSVMGIGAIAFAWATIALDEALPDWWLRSLDLTYAGGAEGASAVLQTIAGSMITIAGVVFSMTLVALSLASSQFGPRLLRNFMRDTINQAVLGTFVATFLYCLLVLRAIRHAGNDVFVPHLSVTFGVLFALASLYVLIYFIHHVSMSIHADEIVARVGEELCNGIERLFPQPIENAGNPAAADAGAANLPPDFAREARVVAADEDGYLQIADADALMSLATEQDLLLELRPRPGDYVVKGSPLAMAWPAERLSDACAERVRAAFVLGTQRTPAQDCEFSIHQLVEIAARALSPGMNDPFTAVACVDRLGSALCRLAQREMPSPYRRDDQRRLRVIAPVVRFADLLDAAFNQIRQDARGSFAVTLRLLETIAVIAAAARRQEDRAALQRHAEMIVRGALREMPELEDRQAVEARYETVLDTLRSPART